MLERKAPVFLLLAYSHLLLVPVAAGRHPDGCSCNKPLANYQTRFHCKCPSVRWKGSPCSWIGYGGITYRFDNCLNALPTGFLEETGKIYINHLRSSTLLEWSFPNVSSLVFLQIQKSNVSAIRPGAFRESETFHGLKNLNSLLLSKNDISVISKHAFSGLPRLTTLHLYMNELTSVPVDALLQPQVLKIADLTTNYITKIDRDITRLEQNLDLCLLMAQNTLQCGKDLSWFICNLPGLVLIKDRFKLKCMSTSKFQQTLLHTISKDDCQTNTDRSLEGTGSIEHDHVKMLIATVTATAREDTAVPETTAAAYLYSQTIPTENYTEFLSTSDMLPSQHTTEKDHVILLGGDPIINNVDNSTYILAMAGAVVVPLLFVLAMVGILFLYKRWRSAGLANRAQQAAMGNKPTSSEAEGSQIIELPAVVNSNSAASDGNSATDQTSGDNDTIQPYAVAYDEDDGQGIKPYAVAYKEDLEQNDNFKIPLYAADHPSPP
uniref:LRRCT domain-containing protein n=1 Tax=Branchiostoma floridae TaxID=7739 RepID=C3YRF4_BRAFL|eukprot:XP_002601139.1 hypothetical protein BRAFLDRAFT_75586 [Branchiostoma floridae]